MIKKIKETQGFTLIELLTVLIILGVLASFAMTSYTAMIEKSRAAEAAVMLRVINTKLENCGYTHNASEAQYSDCVQANIADFNGSFFVMTMLGSKGQGTNVSYALQMFPRIFNPNAPGGHEPGCEDYIQPFDHNNSGISLCRQYNGKIVITGWGYYAGIF